MIDIIGSQIALIVLLLGYLVHRRSRQSWLRRARDAKRPVDISLLPGSREEQGGRVLLSLILVFVLTILLRSINLDSSWDVFVDEITYLRISQGFAESHRMALYGEPFHLHPPAFLILEAGYLEFIDLPREVVHQVYAVRPLNVVLAGVSAVLIAHIVRQLAGWKAGLLAGVIFAVDPFIIRMNSRNYLDTLAVVCTLAGYAVLVSAISRRHRHIPALMPIGAGLAFGLAILTKEMTVFQAIAPLGLCIMVGWSLPRRILVVTAATAIGCYGGYLALIIAGGEWGSYYEDKTRGLERFAGTVQETGFNQPGGPSFARSIVTKLDQFGTSYALIGFGIVALVILAALFRGSHARLILAWALCSCVQIVYSVSLGTLEEQFFYSLVIPSIVVLVGTVALVLRGVSFSGGVPTSATIGLRSALIVYLIVSGGIWAEVHVTTQDNGVEQVVSFVESHVPPGSRIGFTNTPIQFVLDGYQLGLVESVDDIEALRPEYVVVSVTLIESGYNGPDALAVPDWLDEHGNRLFVVDGRSLGVIAVYRLAESLSGTDSSMIAA